MCVAECRSLSSAGIHAHTHTLTQKNTKTTDPTLREALDGRWRLLYTSRPGTASPIQRSFVGVDAFSIFQEVFLREGSGGDDDGDGDDDVARVNNVVDFGPSIGFLRVEAEASTQSRPLPGFTPRAGAGLPLFGRSETYPPARPHSRIDFQFDRAAFHFRALPFTVRVQFFFVFFWCVLFWLVVLAFFFGAARALVAPPRPPTPRTPQP
jgi:hypothetical protein